MEVGAAAAEVAVGVLHVTLPETTTEATTVATTETMIATMIANTDHTGVFH